MGQFNFHRPDSDIPVEEKPADFKRPASDIPAPAEKKSPDHTTSASPTGADLLENGGIIAQPSPDTNPTGFRKVEPSKTISVPNKTITDVGTDDAQVERMQKQQADAQAQYDKAHPDTGHWSNALPTLFHATVGVVTKGLAGVGNIARDISGIADDKKSDSAQPLYKTDPWGESTGELTDYGKTVDAGKTRDVLGRLVIGLDAYNNETAKTDYENHLPKTFLGNTATGLINIAPIAATAALFPEAGAAEGGTAESVNLASLQKLKNIAINPFTKVSAIQGGLNAYDEAKQRGETPGGALLEGVKGAATEGGQAAVYNMLGEFGANFVSPKIAKGLTETGLIKNGKLTRIGTDATADAIVFSAYPIASNLVQGKPVDWDEVEQGLGTGLAFGGMKGMHTYADFTEADAQLKQTGDAVAMKNFYDAAPEAIQAAYHLPDNAVDLNAKAINYAARAKAETNLDERKQLIAASSMYQKMADVKTTTQAILGNPSEFISNINADETLTPEQKTGLIHKITSVPEIIKGTEKADPIINFTSAAPEDLVSAMQRPESAEELQSLAFAKKMEAQNATEPDQQAQLDAEHQQLQQHADIKSIGETVINHGIEPFTTAVNGSDLPEDVKSTLISKAHGINQEFNPVMKEQGATQQTVTDLTDKIDHLQSIPGATDPMKNPAGVNDLIDMVEKRTDAQVDLLAKVVDNPNQIPTQLELKQTDWDSIPAVKSGRDDYKNILKHPDNYHKWQVDLAVKYIDNPLQKWLDHSEYHQNILAKDSNSESSKRVLEENEPIIKQLQAIEEKYKPNEQAQKEETKTAAGAGVPENTSSDRVLEGGFLLKSKDFGQITIVPRPDGDFDIHNDEGGVTRATKEEIANTLNFDTDKIGAPEHIQTLHGTENPNEIARLYDEKMRELKEPANSIEHAIANYGPTTTREQFGNTDDLNHLKGSPTIALNYFRKDGVNNLDTQADEINRLYFNGEPKVTEQDITDFMKKYPKGVKSFFTPKGNAELGEIAQRYRDLTGKDIDTKKARKLAAEFDKVSAGEIRSIEEKNQSADNIEKVKRFIDEYMNKPGLHDSDFLMQDIEDQFERYINDPNNEFNIFHDVFKGDLLTEEEIKDTKDEIENKKIEQRAGDQPGDGSANEAGSETPGPEAQERGSQRKPSEVEQEYDQHIADKKGEVKDFEKQIESKLADLSKKNDLFESTGTKKGEDAQQDIFDKTATNTEPDNIRQILEPIRAKLETAKRELADLENNREAVFEQAKKQYQIELDDIPFQRGEGTNIPPERANVIQGLMKKVFPNVGTDFHPTIDSFAEAARASGIDATDLPNAFIDKTGTIHFNPEAIHADTQVHEYGHILVQWAKENSPILYKRMTAFGRDAADIKAELKTRGYKVSGSQLNGEAFVTMLGRHGEGKLDEVIKNSGTRGTVAKFITDLWTKFQRYLIDKTGFDISKFKNIKDMPINEFLDTVNSKYLLSDTKISDIGTKEYSQIDQQRPERPMRNQGESMADYMRRVIDWTKEQTSGQKTADFNEDVNKEPDGFTLEQEKLKPGYNFSETSIKNRVVAEERRARFLDEVESHNKRDFGTIWDSGKKMIDERKMDPAVFTENLIKNPRPLMPEETAALTYDRMRLYNDHQVTMDQISDAMEAGNKTTETEARVRLAYIEDRIEKNDIAAKQAGYEQGLGLAARRMITAQDYSLANQIQLAKVANGGRELPEDVRLKLESLSKQLLEAQKKLSEYESNASAQATARSLARLKKEAELEQRTERKQKRSQSQEQIKKNIENIKSSILDKLRKNKGTTSTILPYADKLAEITPDLAKLAKEYIKSGIVSIEGIVDAVHADIKDHLEGITKRDVRDALSGYGKTNKPTKETIEAQLRELKAQMRLTSALEDAQGGEKPLKSGYVHEKPSETVRDLQKQVHDAMRANGIEVERTPISEEDAWKSALDSTKTRLKNQIEDLNKQLETGIKPDKKNSVILDQEAQDLKAERDRLKAAVAETETNKELTDEKRVKILTKSTEKSIEEYQKRIDDIINPKDEADQPKKTSVEDLVNKTPELKALRDRLAELKDIHNQLKDEGKPKLSPEEVALYAFKKRQAQKLADLQDAIDRGDFAKAPKKEPLALDNDAKRMQSEVFKLQRKFDEAREKIRLANRTKLEKRLDWASKYRRFILLSNLTTVAKLTAAGATRLITSPLEEVAGHGLSLIPGLDRVSAKAPREGGRLNIQAEADSLAQVLSKRSIQEMYRTVKEGRSELDERVDDKDRTFKENSVFELPGRIHAALKTVPKQVEYYRSLNKRIAWALRNGYDITSPDIQTSLQMEAFKDQNPELFTGKTVAMSDIEKQAFNDGKRAIFMQDNMLSDEFQAMVKRWETRGPKGELAATIARIFLPIIKIPTNFVAETSSLAFGGVKAVLALSKGIDNLTPEDADYVMRALKKQSIGAAFFALGYLLPNNVGGFYRQGEKRKKNGPEADDLIIFGEKVPHWLMHAPVFEVMQMGATVRNVHDQYENDRSKSGLDEAITSSLTAGKGLFGQVPFFGEPAELTRGLENEESLKKFSANFVLGIAVPYDVQRVAKWMDEDSHGNTIPRKEKGFIQYMESGIPVLRENLKKK